jgi:Protein-L-isoaspartate(D-aspartate) O-methyltransferase (PCMT)
MSVLETTFMRMFGRPTGMLGKLGGIIMARVNAPFARCVIRLLDVQPRDKVLEIGFGPGVGIQLLAKSAPEGRVAGIDCSVEMVEQALRVTLKRSSVASSTCGTAPWRNSHSKTAPSMRCWQSTRCKCGQMSPPDCMR